MKTTDNLFEFTADWEKLAEKAGVTAGQALKKVSLDLWTEITRRTPVKHGYAQANWHLTQGTPSQEISPVPNPKFEGVIPPPPQPDVSGIDGTQDIFVINNLPYIEPLEHGHSKQAPSGMVAVSIEAVKARTEAFLNTNE
jgi:hypothetical protein